MSTLRNINVWQRMDKSLLFLYLALVFMGLSTVYSSSYNVDFPSIFNWKEEYGKQFIWICISLTLGFFILLVEGNFIRNSAYLVYGVVLLLLLVVLFMPAIKGAHSWFKIGSFTIQPAEFAKFASALAIARYLSTTGVKMSSFSTKLKTFYFLIVPMILIVLEPDPGTGLVFLSFILVLYREGMSGNFLLAGLFMVILAVISIYIAAFEDVEGYANSWNAILIFTTAIVVVGGLTMLIIRLFVMPRYRMTYILPAIYSTVCAVLLIVTV